MLEPAYIHKDALQKIYQETIYKDRYKYYVSDSYHSYEITIEKNSWNHLQFVSIDDQKNIRGYLGASIDRNTNSVSNLAIINFLPKPNVVFSKDLNEFLLKLFDYYKFRKMNFRVVIGNPIEKMYDKYIKKFGGRVVGIFKEDVVLEDGSLCNSKLYEILKSEYDESKKRGQKDGIQCDVI